MITADLELQLMVEKTDAVRKFIEEIKAVPADVKVGQVNMVGGLGEFVVIAFHWTPLAIHILMAFLHKKKPKRLQIKTDNFTFVIENDGFSEPSIMKILELLLPQQKG